MPASRPLPTTDRLLELVRSMAGQPVLVLADMVADRFITGTPKRISREAPVLILHYQGETLTPGGGANAVANIAALGGVPLPLGIVGEDDSGRRLIGELQARGIETGGILVRPGYRTPTKTRILGGGKHSIKQQIVRYDVEEEIALAEPERARLRERLAAWRGRARSAVVSDYGYGSVEPALVSELRAALAPGGSILGDSRFRLAEFRGLDGATPNEEEAEALLGREIDDDDQEMERLQRDGRLLRERLGVRFLLVTRGSRGMALFDEGREAHLPVHGTDQVADVTGAGDTVIGTFALALAAGATPLEAALLADYAGGVVVMKMGTATLGPAELEAALRADRRPLEEMRWGES